MFLARLPSAARRLAASIRRFIHFRKKNHTYKHRSAEDRSSSLSQMLTIEVFLIFFTSKEFLLNMQ